MYRATDAVFDKRDEINRSHDQSLPRADLRTAAYVLALDRVAQTATARGVWP